MAETAQKPIERIRGPEMRVLIPRSQGVPLVEALRKADEGNFVIVGNKRHDKALAGDEWQKFREVYACHTGTLAAYVEPNTKFGKSKMYSKEAKGIVYTDSNDGQRYIFPVAEQFLSKKNGVFVVEHPDYKLGYDGKDLVVLPEPGKVELVSNFPTKDGWYLTDAKFGIPNGKETGLSNPDSRYLVRVNNAGRVGAVRRGYGSLDDNDRRGVSLYVRPSLGLGVAVESVGVPTDASHKNVAVEEIARGAGARLDEVQKVSEAKLPPAPLEAAKLRITQEGQRLIVEGTPEQLKAAVKLLEQLKQ